MAAGLGLLGLSPREFWEATPREIAAGLRGKLGIDATFGPLRRSDIEGLMLRFPDQE